MQILVRFVKTVFSCKLSLIVFEMYESIYYDLRIIE